MGVSRGRPGPKEIGALAAPILATWGGATEKASGYGCAVWGAAVRTCSRAAQRVSCVLTS